MSIPITATSPALKWLTDPVASPCQTSIDAALTHQSQLTKPPGALGRLETLAVQLAGLQQQPHPHIHQVHISIFAADHGIARAGVSAFPQAVTGQMVANFASGGAAIAVLARELGASLRVSNLGTVEPLAPITGVDDDRICAGTANFAEQPAMTEQQLAAALAIGKRHIDEIADNTQTPGQDLFIGGEMGIGNTTAASAIAATLTGQAVSALVGPGTGVNQTIQQLKTQLIEQAIDQYQLNGSDSGSDPLQTLRCVGGLEIAALTGAYLRAGQRRIPVLVDGFIASTAALVAIRLQPQLQPWLIMGHASAEPGHRLVITALGLEPVVQMNLRLGEGSGAACAVPLVKLACALHNQMATFASAGVSQE